MHTALSGEQPSSINLLTPQKLRFVPTLGGSWANGICAGGSDAFLIYPCLAVLGGPFPTGAAANSSAGKGCQK